MRLHMEGLPGPVSLCPRSGMIADQLASVLIGWPVRIDPADGGGEPFLHVEREGDEFRLHRPDDGFEIFEPNDVSAVCSAVLEIIDGRVEGTSDMGSLHGGAVEFAGRLIVFPAGTRAGKSTLVTRLGAAGHRVFSDDLIPIDMATHEAVATGCLPRPRLPLPPRATGSFVDFVARHAVLEDGYYCYVDPGEGRRARFGDRLAIGAVVLLRRSEEPVAARLEAASHEEALWKLVSQDTRKSYLARDALDDYLRLVGSVGCSRLVYSDLEDAVECLQAAFASWPSEAPSSAPMDMARPETRPQVAAMPEAGGSSGPLYRRAPHVHLRVVGDSGFLANDETQHIHTLNAIGLALWNLLDQPAGRDQLCALFAEAFPDIPADTIATDIGMLIDRLHEGELVETV